MRRLGIGYKSIYIGEILLALALRQIRAKRFFKKYKTHVNIKLSMHPDRVLLRLTIE
jgi:hypothetical protein